MKAEVLKKKFLSFFRSKKHKVVPGVSLIPEGDPTVLFTTAGMHPLVPYLLGAKHPSGRRLANVQKCIRTGDIEEVGDDFHLSYFEMLGNWSLGDYFKEDTIKYSFEFLTNKKWLGLDKERIYVTCFKGDKNAPKDTESAKIWNEVGIDKDRIFFLGKSENWWGPAGENGPCGPDTEVFYDTGKKKCSRNCMPGCNCGKYTEIWNDVFMEYNKKGSRYVKLKQKNVDTGMGVERTLAVINGFDNVYDTEFFKPVMDKLSRLSKVNNVRASRIIADHLRASVFILSEKKIVPSNLDQGYILRRFIRRSIRFGKLLGIENFLVELAEVVIRNYKLKNRKFILDELKKEEEKFGKTLELGLKKFDKLARDKVISGKDSFVLFSSYGFPMEMTKELAKERRIKVDEKGYEKEYIKHQQISRVGGKKRFKGGLADHGVKTTKLHTAAHLLHAALRKVLGKHVFQKGSNITEERLRLDFSHDKKVTPEELEKVEELVNNKIKEKLEIRREEMSLADAKKKGAIGVFGDRYGAKVSVYSIGSFDKEICGGPHVENTKELGKFKIIKEESISAGVRRIKAVLE